MPAHRDSGYFRPPAIIPILRQHGIIVAAMLAMLAGRLSIATAATPPDPAIVKLQLQVDALSTLDDLQLSHAQVAALRALASDTAAAQPAPQPNLDTKYLTALNALHDALLKGDADKIEDAQDDLDDTEDKLAIDPQPDIEPTDAARAKASAALKLLSPRQLAGFLAQNADDVPDPTEILLDALSRCHGLSRADFQNLCDDTTDDLGVLIGAQAAKSSTVIPKTIRLLDRARRLSSEDFLSQHAALETEARQIAQTLDPITCLRHWMESELADLLSNPQLNQALTDWDATRKILETSRRHKQIFLA